MRQILRHLVGLLFLLIAWGLTNQPTSATAVVSRFVAQCQSRQVRIDWTTSTEIGNIGFNLLRSNFPLGPYTQVNSTIIPSKCNGCIEGAIYSYADPTVSPGQIYYYQLESVDTEGNKQIFGPVATIPACDFVDFFPFASKQSSQPLGCNGTPVISYFFASPASILPGQSATLGWGTVTNADMVTLDPDIGEVGTPGPCSVSPVVTTTYTLTARCGSNAAERNVTITVLPP